MFIKGIKNLIVAFLFVFLLCHQTCLTVICEENSAQVYPHLIFQNGYYGYVNDSGKIIIPCQWEDAGEFRGRGYASVMIDRQTQEYGIIDINGNYVMRFIGGIEEGQNGVYCGGMHTGIYWLQNEEGVGFFDVTTGYFSGFIFHRNQDIWYCCEESDLVRVSIDGTYYGYVNTTNGELQIPYVFTGECFSGFVGGYTIDQRDDTYIVFNEKGDIVPLPDELVPVSLGDLITVRDKESGLFGFADYNGNCIISPQYEDVSTHLNGYASFLQDGKWGHIDRMGNICCSPKYDNEYWFNGISFAVSLEQQPLLIDEDGHTLREFDCHSELSYFTNELILVTNDEGTSLINRLGTDIIEPERKLFIDSERGCNVYEQLIIVKDQQECWGYADLSGNVVCPCIWDSVSPFFNGWALVESEKKAFYIDHSMHIVFTFEECDTLLH